MVTDPGMKAAAYVALMFIGVIGIQLTSGRSTRLDRIHQGVLFWSGLIYTGFVFDVVLIENTGWYLDWIVSTQLMLLAVLVSSGTRDARKILLTLGSQVVVIVTGLVTEVTGDLLWFGVGSVFALFVLYQLWSVDWPSAGQKRWLFGWIAFFWILYPALWLVGTPGYGVVSPETTSILFLVVPAISKIGLAVVDLAAPWADIMEIN